MNFSILQAVGVLVSRLELQSRPLSDTAPKN